jgi:hypothetical protein
MASCVLVRCYAVPVDYESENILSTVAFEKDLIK